MVEKHILHVQEIWVSLRDLRTVYGQKIHNIGSICVHCRLETACAEQYWRFHIFQQHQIHFRRTRSEKSESEWSERKKEAVQVMFSLVTVNHLITINKENKLIN